VAIELKHNGKPIADFDHDERRLIVIEQLGKEIEHLKTVGERRGSIITLRCAERLEWLKTILETS